MILIVVWQRRAEKVGCARLQARAALLAGEDRPAQPAMQPPAFGRGSLVEEQGTPLGTEGQFAARRCALRSRGGSAPRQCGRLADCPNFNAANCLKIKDLWRDGAACQPPLEVGRLAGRSLPHPLHKTSLEPALGRSCLTRGPPRTDRLTAGSWRRAGRWFNEQ